MSRGMVFALAAIGLALMALIVVAFFFGTDALIAMAIIVIGVLALANWPTKR